MQNSAFLDILQMNQFVSNVISPLQSWIREKAKLVESTDELGNDLAGVMTLQRRLSGLERDLAAIQAKVSSP